MSPAAGATAFVGDVFDAIAGYLRSPAGMGNAEN
jgi:hypothetical protein